MPASETNPTPLCLDWSCCVNGAVWTSLDIGASPVLSSNSETDYKLFNIISVLNFSFCAEQAEAADSAFEAAQYFDGQFSSNLGSL